MRVICNRNVLRFHRNRKKTRGHRLDRFRSPHSPNGGAGGERSDCSPRSFPHRGHGQHDERTGITSPQVSGEAVINIVRNTNGVGFIFERNCGEYWPEDLFLRDPRSSSASLNNIGLTKHDSSSSMMRSDTRPPTVTSAPAERAIAS